MGRKFDFDNSTMSAAITRQKWKCALKGENLKDILYGTGDDSDWLDSTDLSSRERKGATSAGAQVENKIYAHHIIPEQTWKHLPNANDAKLKDVDNCVYLCYHCHDRAHGGAKGAGAVMSPKEFVFSHGGGASEERKLWVERMEAFWRLKFDSKKP